MNIDKHTISFEKHDGYHTLYMDNNMCGTCSYVIPRDDRTLIYIMYLDISVRYQNMGCGTILLYQVLSDAYENGVTHVKLDDVSDNCHKQNNIYKKMGLWYVDGKNDNSMCGNLRNILYGRKKYRSECENRFLYY
jgi:hypothetical protein